MKRLLAELGVVLCVLLSGAHVRAGSATSDADRKFLVDAAARSRGDIALGELAIHRGVDPSVKLFGRQTVEDYTALQNQLNRLARNKRVTLPTGMTAADRATYDQLARLSAERFDSEYLQVMSTRHSDEIDDFEAEAGTGNDADVRRWAMEKVTTLRAHRDEAMDNRMYL
jgi:putative membrane protein